MNFVSLIEAKRDGQALTDEQLREIVRRYCEGGIPDYQMAALLMAVFFNGLDHDETRALTLAMRDSGDVLRWPDDPRPVVDKHSTGGVGDKVSLVLAPLLACLGFRVPMISGRGLGITGGTLDKMESIPGFRTQLSPDEIVRIVQETGCCICGQSERVVPADRRMYALRDVTGTIPSIPLITASIMSKKLAEGISALLLDVKVGEAAFMRTPEEARTLAGAMVNLANRSGVRTRALLTDMDTPLGRAAGNWLEVRESVECLDGSGPADLQEVVIECAAHLLVETGKAASVEDGRATALASLESGDPRKKWDEFLVAQGADLNAMQRRLAGDTAPVILEVRSEAEGFVNACRARILGEIVRDLGGGRLTADATLDSEAGIDALKKPGEHVQRGSVLARIHGSRHTKVEEARRRLTSAFEIGPMPLSRKPLVHEIIVQDGPR